MARKIVLTSGKGGVGKTSICANLGYKIAKAGLRVLLIDVDIGLNNLDVVMGVENKIVFDIVDVLENKCRPKQAIIQDVFNPTLFVMPSAHSYNKAVVTTDNIRKLVYQLDPYYDYILLDCPAGIDMPFQRAVKSADEAIVVVTPHISSLRDADKVISILSSMNMSRIQLVINRVRGDLVLSKEMIDVEQITSLLRIELLGVIPEDDEITTSSSLGLNVSDRSYCSLAFKQLAENLHNGTSNIFDCTQKYKGVIGYIRKSIKRRV